MCHHLSNLRKDTFHLGCFPLAWDSKAIYRCQEWYISGLEESNRLLREISSTNALLKQRAQRVFDIFNCWPIIFWITVFQNNNLHFSITFLHIFQWGANGFCFNILWEQSKWNCQCSNCSIFQFALLCSELMFNEFMLMWMLGTRLWLVVSLSPWLWSSQLSGIAELSHEPHHSGR